MAKKDESKPTHRRATSVIDVKPSQLLTLLKSAFQDGQRVLVIGEPGQGKSEITAQAAREIDYDFLLSHPAVEDPTAVTGMPDLQSNDDFATFKPFGTLYKALTATKPTVWCLDDLGQGPFSVQAAYMQFLLGGRLNEHKLPDHVVMCAATNERNHKSGVVGILEAVKDRFDAIVRLVPNWDESKQWFYTHNAPTEMIGFLEMRPDLLSKFEPTGDMTKSPTPRSWAKCAKWIRKTLDGTLPRELQLAAYAGCIGEGAALELQGVLDQLVNMPDLKEIIKNPAKAPIPDQPEVMYAVCTGLAHMATRGTFAKIAQYAQRLEKARKTEFAALLLKDTVFSLESDIDPVEFKELAESQLGRVLIGRAKAA